MFAVIKTGGKQYKVQKGDVLSIEKLSIPQGEKIQLSDILMIHDGKEMILNHKETSVNGTSSQSVSKEVMNIGMNIGMVEAEVIEHYKDDKVLIFKKRRRKNYRRMKGHRQMLTKIKIHEIKVS